MVKNILKILGLFLFYLVILGMVFCLGYIFAIFVPAEKLLFLKQSWECQQKEVNRDNLAILINEYRLQNSREMLKSNEVLEKFAQARAEELFTKKIFTHQSQLGTFNQWQKKNLERSERIRVEEVAELIAQGARNACEVVESWKTSLTHNNALLDADYQLMGLGISGNVVVLELATSPQQ